MNLICWNNKEILHKNSRNNSKKIKNLLNNLKSSQNNLKLFQNYFLPFYFLKLNLSLQNEVISSNEGPIRCLNIDNIQTRYLLTGGIDCKVCLYDLESQNSYNNNNNNSEENNNINIIQAISQSRKDENYGHNYSISSVKWYPTDLECFISSSFDGKVNVWDTELFEIAGNFDLGCKVYDCSMNQYYDHSIIACATEKFGIRLCDLRTGGASQTIGIDTLHPKCLDWCPYQENILVSGNIDGTVIMWDIRKAGMNAQTLSFDHLQDHSTKLDRTKHQKVDWNRQLAAKAHTKSINSIKFTPGGNYLVSCGNDKVVRLWNINTGKLQPIRYRPCNSSPLRYDIDIINFSSSSGDELLLYPGSNRDILLTPLHSSTGEPIKVLSGHLDQISGIQVLSDYRVVSVGIDGMIFLWDQSQELQDLETEHNNDWLNEQEKEINNKNNEDIFEEREFIPNILRNYMSEIPL